MEKLRIFTIDELHKSMVTHEFRKPPSMGPKLRTVEPHAEGYKRQKSRPTDNPKVKKQAFSVRRKKGPEEGKRYAKRVRQEKQAERQSDIEIYGEPIEKGKSIKEWKEYLQIDEPEKAHSSDNISSIGRSKKDYAIDRLSR